MAGLSVLLVGSGGREHALAWSLARSPEVAQIYVTPGNAGTGWSANPDATGWQTRAASENVPIAAEDIPALITFAREKQIDLAVIGPEVPLSMGIVDAFQSAQIRVFGPTKAAAQLESSKAFAKAFMQENDIPTAAYGTFDDYGAAREFVRDFGKPVVVKADGLAAGKGVIVCENSAEADAALWRILIEREFGDSGSRVVIEECLSGREVSALAFSDGKHIAVMPFARDHKRVFDDDQGPNTGGMGAYAPVPDADDAFRAMVARDILQRAVDGMAARGTPYVGVLYAGLMLTADGVRVLEFNCRFGDPETQVILPLLETSLAQILLACAEGRLDPAQICWRDGACATVVLASPGYPGSYPKGLPISGLDSDSEEVVVFHAGTAQQNGQVVTAGGRVLSVSAYGEDFAQALDRAYRHIGHIQFEGMHYRQDIGRAR